MIFARIGHGTCYYHWNEIFAGVAPSVSDLSRVGTLFWIGATEEELAESRSHFTFSLEFLPTMLECQ